MKTLSLRNIDIARIAESETPTNPRFLYPGITAQDIAPYNPLLTPHFYNPDEFRFIVGIATFVVRTRHHTVLVDTCVGNDKKRSNPFWNRLATPYLDSLQSAGVAPDEVDFVLCTHMHTDHVGWNTHLVDGKWAPTFPKARYVFNRSEYEFWERAEGEDARETFSDSVLPIMEAGLAVLVDGEHEITEGVSLEPTPGHTPGHYSVRVGWAGGRPEAVITGDIMHHPLQMLEPGRNSVFCEDAEQARATRRDFLERYAERDVRIVGTHFAPPTAGRIVGHADAFRLEV